MAQVDPVAKTQAVAVGGPTAGAEYAAQQRGVQDIKQQALSDAASRSGALQAPAAFRQQQADLLSAPLDAQAQSLGTMSGAAGALQGANNSALNRYLAGFRDQSMQNAAQNTLEPQAQSDYAGAYSSLHALRRQNDLDAKQAVTDAEKSAAKVEKNQKDEIASRKEFARQDAAADNTLGGGSYQVIEDVLKHADDPATAKRYFEQKYVVDPKTGAITDDQGNELSDANVNLIDSYITKALAPDQYQGDLPGDHF